MSNKCEQIIARDINGRIILSTDRVKPVGDCRKTDAFHSLVGKMINIVNSEKYFTITRVKEDKIEFGGFSWHPSDVQIERKLIILPPIESVTFNVNNLDIE